jgi:hypothetical protein
MKYRKKPVVIEAIQWTGKNLSEITAFCGDQETHTIHDAAWEVGRGAPIVRMTIKTLEGDMTATPGDFIIKGVNGEFYPCKPDIFAKTYEPAEDAVSFDAALRGTVGPQSFSDRTPGPRGAEVTE